MTTKASRNSMEPTATAAFSACQSFFAGNTAANRLCDTALAVSFFVFSIPVVLLLRSVLVLPSLISLIVLLKFHRKVKLNG